MASYLRGSLLTPHQHAVRALQAEAHHDRSWLMRGIVAMIALFFFLSLYQFIVSRCCKRRSTAVSADSDNGVTKKVFTLTDDQRRAVLEAIYADNSKPAKELDVTPQRDTRWSPKSLDENSVSVDSNADIGIPIILKLPGFELQESSELCPANKELNLEFACIEISLSSDNLLTLRSKDDCEDAGEVRNQHFLQSHVIVKAVSNSSQGAAEHLQTDNHLQSRDDGCSLPDCANTTAIVQHDDEETGTRETFLRYDAMDELADDILRNQSDVPVDSQASVVPPVLARSCPSCCQTGIPGSTLCIGTHSEPAAATADLGAKNSANASPNSFAAQACEFAYEDDASCVTGDNVCPICLSGYITKSLLITSKHCSHVFHKDCIMEWLQKNDDCPICRTSMVTESEMNQAASFLVGKTRMYRAVASMTSQSRRPLAPSRQGIGGGLSMQADVTPLSGTVLRSVSINFT